MKTGHFMDRKWAGFAVILFFYIAAAWIGTTVYQNMGGAMWLRLLAADVIATSFIWVTSLIFQNASIYDPYWSVQPALILTMLAVHIGQLDIGAILIYSVILLWSIRLTLNWAYTFEGLGRQDWRYDQIQKQTGWLYPVVNLLGIQMMPTIIVFMCMLPAVYMVVEERAFHPTSLAGLSVSAAGVILQMAADWQLQFFRKCAADRRQIIRTGLWKHARHPNYLGEMMMWWGVYLSMLPAHLERWYLLIGALMNTLLFLLISIPMAEKHLAGYKDNYAAYQSETRVLLPVPKKFLCLK